MPKIIYKKVQDPPIGVPWFQL